MKKKVLIAILILLIVIYVSIIIILKSKQGKNIENTDTNTLENVASINYDEVKSATAFFTVESVVNKFVVYVADKDVDSVLKILDNKFIEDNNVNTNNVLEKIKGNNISGTFEAEKMYVEEIDENNNKYYVKGTLKQELEGENAQDIIINDNFCVIVSLDFDNMIFSITPLEDGGMFNEKAN